MNTILSLYEKQLAESSEGRPILTVINSRLQAVSYTHSMLNDSASRSGNCLLAAGCMPGDRVLISARETLPVWSFFWGALKIGAVPCILFPGLGTGGLAVRLKAARACFLVTDMDPAKLPDTAAYESLKKVILLGKPSEDPATVFYREEEWSEHLQAAAADPDDDAFIIFTSGTSGTPKPVMHRQGIADAVVRSMKNILHADPSDIYWCTAHPAWITGTVYGILGPVLCGISSLQYDGSFHAKRWMPILQDRKVTLWYTAPTALRALMREDPEFFTAYDLSSLKQIYSIGEPLSARVYEWCAETFRRPVYDTWFQTETGTIRIANQPGREIIPGWMGKPVDDTDILIAEPGPEGIGKLCLKAGFDSMFRGYYGMPEETARKFSRGYYETGDLAGRGPDGTLRYEGRADDVINTSGHLVGPLEVEQVLMTDPSVAAAAVAAEPDDLSYEVPAAFIILSAGTEWSHELEMKLRVAVNTGVSVYAVPKHFYIVDSLPETASGKINRAELRARLAAV